MTISACTYAAHTHFPCSQHRWKPAWSVEGRCVAFLGSAYTTVPDHNRLLTYKQHKTMNCCFIHKYVDQTTWIYSPSERMLKVHVCWHQILIMLECEVILTVHHRYYVEIKYQLDATDDIYCRFYCMLNMFQAILCPSSGAREYYTDGRCLWYLVLWFSGCRCDVELKVMCLVCRLLQQPANRMGIVLPETCWACNKICNKYHLLHLVGILFPHNNDDVRSKSLQIYWSYMTIVPISINVASNHPGVHTFKKKYCLVFKCRIL